MTEEQEDKLSSEEEAELFKFDNKTLDDYEEDATIDKGEYVLEVDGFLRAVKVVTEENIKEGNVLGEKIPYATIKLRHKKDKNGKLDAKLMGRRYEVLLWDLRRESTRDEAGDLYRTLGFTGAYVPKYNKNEFIRGDGESQSRAFGTFYIGKYLDNQTKRMKNSRPRPVNDRKSKKQEAKDAKGPVEI